MNRSEPSHSLAVFMMLGLMGCVVLLAHSTAWGKPGRQGPDASLGDDATAMARSTPAGVNKNGLGLGDADDDGDIDRDDFSVFADCLAGPQLPPVPTPPTTVQQCLDAFDFDADTDIDARDFKGFQAVFTGSSGPCTGLLTLANGTFTRPGAKGTSAFLDDKQGMTGYWANQPRTEEATRCSASNGQFIVDQINGGANSIGVHCHDGTYFYGVSDEDPAGVYRSLDGIYWGSPLRTCYAGCVRIFTTSAGSVILTEYIPEYTYFYRSPPGDHGQNFVPCETPTGEDFTFQTAGARLATFGVHQAGGTIIAVEYGDDESANKIYRSADDGATWTMVHAQGSGEPYDPYHFDPEWMRHYHAPGYHAGLHRWVAGIGDCHYDCCGVMASDDDGQTWYRFTATNEIEEQPTAWLDYGHPTRILFGSDRKNQVGWMDISDGPDSKKIVTLIDNWDRREPRCECFGGLFKYDDVIYACGYDMTHNEMRPVISVTEDLEHWAVYHQFMPVASHGSVHGVTNLLGIIDGKIHLQTMLTDDLLGHFSISPAQVVNVTDALVLSPPKSNILNEDTSTGAAVNSPDDVFASLGTLESLCGSHHHGASAFRLAHDSAPMWARTFIKAGAGLGVDYFAGVDSLVGRVRIQGHIADAQFRWFWRKDYGIGEGQQWHMTSPQNQQNCVFQTNGTHEWQDIVSKPFFIPEDTTDLMLVIHVDPHVEQPAYFWMDSIQIETMPFTKWQVGDTPRAQEQLSHSLPACDEWTDIITIVPAGAVTDFEAYNFECWRDSAPYGGSEVPSAYTGAWSSADIQYIQSWYVDAGNYVTLYYDPADRKFKLRYVDGDGSDEVAETSERFFQREALIRLGVRVGATGFWLSICDGTFRDGEAVQHYGQAAPVTAPLGVPFTTCTGYVDGSGLLPHVRVEHLHCETLVTNAGMTDLLLQAD